MNRRTVGFACLLVSGCSGELGAPTGTGAATDATAGSGGNSEQGAGLGGTSPNPPDDTCGEESCGGSEPRAHAIYANGPTTLYQFDPLSNALSIVGEFDCVGDAWEENSASYIAMQDIAVDGQGNLIGLAVELSFYDGHIRASIVRIDPQTALCISESPVEAFELDVGWWEGYGWWDQWHDQDVLQLVPGLAFVPGANGGPADDKLVAVTWRGAVFRIDWTTGATSPVGDKSEYPYQGDIVSIPAGKLYSTQLRPEDGGGGVQEDVVEIDPTSGNVLSVVGTYQKFDCYDGDYYWWWYDNVSLCKDSIRGLAHSGDTLYAFTGDARIYSVNTVNGTLDEVPVANKPEGVVFTGAAAGFATVNEQPPQEEPPR